MGCCYNLVPHSVLVKPRFMQTPRIVLKKDPVNLESLPPWLLNWSKTFPQALLTELCQVQINTRLTSPLWHRRKNKAGKFPVLWCRVWSVLYWDRFRGLLLKLCWAVTMWRREFTFPHSACSKLSFNRLYMTTQFGNAINKEKGSCYLNTESHQSWIIYSKTYYR